MHITWTGKRLARCVLAVVLTSPLVAILWGASLYAGVPGADTPAQISTESRPQGPAAIGIPLQSARVQRRPVIKLAARHRSRNRQSRQDTESAPRGRVALPVRNLYRSARLAAFDASLASIQSVEGKVFLRADDLVARIVAPDAGRTLRAGTMTAVELNLTGSGSKAATLALTVDGPIVRAIRGSSFTIRRYAGMRLISFAGLTPGEERRLRIELEPRATDAGPPHNNSLKIALLSSQLTADASSDAGTFSSGEATLLRWTAVDPPRDYHRALRKLDADFGEEIFKSVQEARVADETLSGEWVFKPRIRPRARRYKTVERTRTTRVCTRYKRRRSGNRRSRTRRCVRWKKRQVVRKTRVLVKAKPDPLRQREAEIIELASNAVRSKGAAPLVRKKARFGWISSRIAVDLRAYMGQDAHPALCTGMDVMMDYMHGGARSFRRRIAYMEAARREAPAIAVTRIQSLRVRITRAEGGHPGWGRGSLTTAVPLSDDADVLMSLRQLTGYVVGVMTTADAGRRVAAVTDTLGALRRAKAEFDTAIFRSHSEADRAAARHALMLIEASYYLRRGNAHFARISKALFGGIQNVRDAHARHCVEPGRQDAGVAQ